MAKKSRATSASTNSGTRAKAANAPRTPNPSSSQSARTPGASGNASAGRTSTTPPSRAERRERRPDVVQQRKEERQRAASRQRQQALFTKIGFAVLAVLIALGAGWWGYGQWQDNKVSGDVTTYFGAHDFTATHVSGDVLYEEVPPVGGPHNAVWQNCGFYNQYINNVNGVHVLEHGAVWITYDPKLPADQVQVLKDKTKQTYILVSPYPGMSAPVIASVWGKQIKLTSATDSRLDQFIKKYRQNTDNTPEPGALCTLGTSATTTTIPQQVPYVRTAGTPPVGGVTVADATATAAAAGGGSPQAATGSPTAPVVGPAAPSTPNAPVGAASPSPAATKPEGTPGS